MERIFDRIGKEIDLEELSKNICITYKLGDYNKYKLILVGIDDLSYVLNTSKGRYLVKIINQEKTNEEINEFIQKSSIITRNNINVPKLIPYEEGYLFTYEIDGLHIDLVVMEYIDGSDLYSNNEHITKADIEKLIDILIPLHKLEEKIENKEYDEYCFMKIKEDYQKTKNVLPKNIKAQVEKMIKEFDKIELEKLPKCFTHGDLISSNIIKDKNKDLWLIDFYQSGIGVRILDIVKVLNSVIDNYKYENDTEELEQYFIEEYNKRMKLTPYELEVLPILRKIDVCTGIMMETFDAIEGRDNEENQYWLENDKRIFERL
ncbi:MAG: phosphotransferase [Clostridia bacterium]|nr:phosphotransferase [Clostridia bacterium]